ncbi:MAG: MarC family protein [Chlamydiales bacterium]
MNHSFFSVTLSLFLLMDSIGNIPLYIAILKGIPARRQIHIIIRELLIALGFIVLFQFAGQGLLNLLGVAQDALLIAGGLILFIIALRMIFPPEDIEVFEISRKEEPFLVPLAIPFVAGPSIFSAVIIYSNDMAPFMLTLSIVIAWLFTLIILLIAPYLKRLLRDHGIIACERLMGLILILIAGQMFLDGLRIFLNNR